MQNIGEGEFDRATSVAAGGSAEIHPGWDIAGNANGGYLVAMAARHMAAMCGRPDPVSVTAHFLAPGTAGPVQVTADVLKAGRRFATVSGSIRRAGRVLLQALGTFGDLDGLAGGFRHVTGAPPELPPQAECLSQRSAPSEAPALLGRLDVSLRPGDVGFATRDRSGEAEVAGYFGFADGRPVDPLALLLVCDAFPPAVFNLAVPVGWVPTVEYTVHVRGVPAPGPLRCVFRSRFVQNGCLDEDGEVWDSRDQLVAQSRQIGLLPQGVS